MANEYLKRTPTSTGNRKVWTWSAWIKRANQYTSNAGPILFSAGTSGSNLADIRLLSDTSNCLDYTNYPGSVTHQIRSTPVYRDSGSWIHILISIDTTNYTSTERLKMFINGSRITDFRATGYPSINDISGLINATNLHYIGRSIESSYRYFDGELTDFFLVDGQALTPDVFGFYKVGKGYISAGSAQATDFRPGQWVPKTPRVIKTAINNNGGFGVNGFYLPMNDSSNFGADFHTTPNSIITLKGEDLPQPRNGAPETTDAYVSQLRTDPYAANLVLAVPGISTATGPNLITNGTFENGTTGWTISNASHGTMTVNSNNQLLLSQTTGGGDGVLHAWQAFTTEIGKRYTVIVEIVGGTASSTAFYVNNSSSFGNAFGSETNNLGNGFKSVSFQATGTTAYILLRVNTTTPNVTSIFDNIVVKQEDAPRDYSADIKGSGTNKTLTANGNAGVGYEIPGYYGSALSFGSAGALNYLQVSASSDFAYGSGNFTIETWWFPTSTTRQAIYHGSWGADYSIGIDYNGASSNLKLGMWASSNGSSWNLLNADAGGNGITAGTPVQNQWNHIAYVRNGSTFSMYLNGVCVGTVTGITAAVDVTASDTQVIGEWWNTSAMNSISGYIQDLRVYKGVAKYTGGFDVPKPYTPVGIESWRAVPDTTANNFATLNAVDRNSGTLTNGNLTFTDDGSDGWNNSRATIGVSTGKYYWEMQADAVVNAVLCASIAGPNGNDSTKGARLHLTSVKTQHSLETQPQEPSQTVIVRDCLSINLQVVS
jgi:hypothetical protein